MSISPALAWCRHWLTSSLAALLLAAHSAPAQALVSTLAGAGTPGRTDGPVATAQFNLPQGLAVDAQGNTYVADTENHLIRRISPAGTVTTIAGTGSRGFLDSPNPLLATFARPQGLALDPAGNLYIADSENAVIRRLDAATGAVTTLAGLGFPGYLDGLGRQAQFNRPTGLVRDAAGNFYVGDVSNYRIRKIDPAGNVTTIAGTSSRGYQDGPAATARFFSPKALALDAAGNLLIADAFGHRVRMLSPAGVVSTVAGTGAAGSTDGPATTSRINGPEGVAVDTAGNIYVADSYGYRIRRIRNGQLSTVAGTAAFGFADGPATTALFVYPTALCFNATGSLYIADAGNYRIRQLTGLTLTTAASQMAASRFALYPNPAMHQITLELPPNTDKATATVRVTTLTGRQVPVEQLADSGEASAIRLSVRNLPEGSYLYRGVTQRGSYCGRFTKSN